MSQNADRTKFFPHVEDAPVSPAVQHFIMEAAAPKSLASHESAGLPATEPAVRHALVVPVEAGLFREWLECGYVGQVRLLSACLQEQHLPVCHL